MRHFISTQDWTVGELQALLDQAAGLRSDPVRPLLQGRTLALLFLNRSLRTRASGGCGREYRVKSVVLVEVTFCAFPDSVPEIVMANMLAKVPG